VSAELIGDPRLMLSDRSSNTSIELRWKLSSEVQAVLIDEPCSEQRLPPASEAEDAAHWFCSASL
jgi:hypothetical protein